jgi:hypothetical protein
MKQHRNRSMQTQKNKQPKFVSFRSFSYSAFQWIAGLALSSRVVSSQAEQPPLDGTSPMSTLPLEILSSLLSFVPLNENLALRQINKEWQAVWNFEMTRQMNPIGLTLGIQPAISHQKGFDALWESQGKEMDYLLSNEGLVLEKTNSAQCVTLAYEQLKMAIEQRISPFALHAREKILNRINEAIIHQRIMKSKLKGNKKLDCDDCSLTRFPATIIDKEKDFWQELLWCSIENNHLTTLPENIGLGTSLLWLSVSHNHLIKIPESIGQCLLLQGLRVSSNHLTTLPESIGLCVALQGLFANNNQLNVLPQNIGMCTALQVLSVYDNQLIALPETLAQCASLQWVCADNNQLTLLPESIGQCIALRSISALNNCISRLPESLAECSALEWLHVGKNFLASIPENISKSKKLKQFSESIVLASQKTLPDSNNENLHEVTRSIRKLKLQ